MDEEPLVVVRKIGLASALVLGVCGAFAVVVVCGTVITIYGMRMVDGKLDELMSQTPKMVAAVSEWIDALPPAVSDALRDRRAPEYRQEVDVTVEMVTDQPTGRLRPVVEVVNQGDQLISLMGLRVVVEDAAGVPVDELITYAATPLAVEKGWPGPLMPGSKRRLAAGPLRSPPGDLTATVEVTELRIWEQEQPARGGHEPGSEVAGAAGDEPDAQALAAPNAQAPATPQRAEDAGEQQIPEDAQTTAEAPPADPSPTPSESN